LEVGTEAVEAPVEAAADGDADAVTAEKSIAESKDDTNEQAEPTEQEFASDVQAQSDIGTEAAEETPKQTPAVENEANEYVLSEQVAATDAIADAAETVAIDPSASTITQAAVAAVETEVLGQEVVQAQSETAQSTNLEVGTDAVEAPVEADADADVDVDAEAVTGEKNSTESKEDAREDQATDVDAEEIEERSDAIDAENAEQEEEKADVEATDDGNVETNAADDAQVIVDVLEEAISEVAEKTEASEDNENDSGNENEDENETAKKISELKVKTDASECDDDDDENDADCDKATGEFASPRVALKSSSKQMARRAFGDGLPLVVCVRCDNTFFLEKRADPDSPTQRCLAATATGRNYKYGIALVKQREDVYELIHIASSSYLSVRVCGDIDDADAEWVLYAVDNNVLPEMDREQLSFTIVKVSEPDEINIRCTIEWRGRYLCTKQVSEAQLKEIEAAVAYQPVTEAAKSDENDTNPETEPKSENQDQEENQVPENEENEENEPNKPSEAEQKEQVHASASDSNAAERVVDVGDVQLENVEDAAAENADAAKPADELVPLLVFAAAYTDDPDAQVFTLEPLLHNIADTELDILYLLDLVSYPRESKIGVPSLSKYKHVGADTIQLIHSIYIRLDEKKIGYAPYMAVWTQFVQYAQGMVPRIVIDAFDELHDKCDVDLTDKLVHIKNFVAAINTVIEFYENEIKMQQIQKDKEEATRKADPIDVKLRRLDDSILTEHPFYEQWQHMSRTARFLYDWKTWLHYKLSQDSNDRDLGFFLWRSHLVQIQGNFGESIFAFFQFTRWLFMVNLVTLILYAVLIACHMYNFDFLDFSLSEYGTMVLGAETTNSWWFYGAFAKDYNNIGFAFDTGFAWVAVSALAVVASLFAVLRVLISTQSMTLVDDEFKFTRHVFIGHDHSLHHPDAITLETNSKMITLHETLLEQLDEERLNLTCVLILKRLLGIVLCVILGLASAAGIVGLLYFEKDVIIPKAEDIHSSMATLAPYIVPAGVTMIKALTPKLVRVIVSFERYSAGFNFQQQFFRVFVLRVFAILVTLFQTARQAEESEDEENAICAESQIGSVLYKFILFDMVIEIVVYGVVPALKWCFKRCAGKTQKTAQEMLQELNQKNENDELVTSDTEFELAGDSGKKSFDIPGGLVDVMYRQCIVWSGMYFSPMIPVMAVLATFVTFFIKKRFLFHHCARPKKALGVTKQLRFFYGMLLLGLVVSCVVFNYFLGRTPNCGPHQNIHILDHTERKLDEEMPNVLRVFFSYLFNGLLLLPLLILALIYLKYLSSAKTRFKDNADQLKHKLIEEKNDKKQLLQDYNIKLG